MNKRVIRVSIEKEPELYKELESAMLEHRGYDGCSCGQKTHPYCDINILPSIVRVTMPLYFASNETYNWRIESS